MSTLMDYAYLRAAADGYLKVEPHYQRGISMEKEIAEGSRKTMKAILELIRSSGNAFLKWLEDQRTTRLNEMKGRSGSSLYLRGLV